MKNQQTITYSPVIETNQTTYEHVMLVDDDPIQNIVLGKMVEKTGFAKRTTLFNSGQEALDFLATASTADLPSVVFLDIVMPEMDGFAFLDAFAKLSNDITCNCKVIMVSSTESFEYLNRANKSRFVKKFLNKPLKEETIKAIRL
ncbi:MAG: two-component system response regulator [Bacteroidota bacterium]|jgi:CheY-like chemotaxis protein